MIKPALICAFVLISGTSYANEIFKITISDYGTTDTNIIAAIDAAKAELEAEIEKSLPDADPSNYTDGLANASVMAGKGIGTDYANDIAFFVVGAGAGVGLDLGDNTLSDLMDDKIETEQIRGVGLQVAAMLGTNFGWLPVKKVGFLELEKLSLYAHYFSKDFDKDEFTADTKNMGFHLKYKVFEGFNLLSLIKWGGLDLHVGLEKAKLGLTYTKVYNDTKEVTTNGLPATATYSATAVADADIETTSIPIEISTYFSVFDAITAFGGIGVDFNSGEAKATGDLRNSSLTLTQGSITATGTASLDLGDKGEPDSMTSRWFIGGQINIPYLPFARAVKIVAQYDKAFGDNLYGISAGVRVAW
jgi:hypothetical protein